MPDLHHALTETFKAGLSSHPDHARHIATALHAASTQSGTSTKSEANYRKADDPATSCATCTHFEEPSSCALVSGKIAPDHVSDLYDPKPSSSSADTTSVSANEGSDPNAK